MIGKRHITMMGVMLLLVISTRVLLRTPIESYLYMVEAAFLVALVGYLPFYLFEVSLRKRISWLEGLILALFFVPLLSAYSAFQEFGQPFLYGVLAQRDFYLISVSLVFITAFKRGWLDTRMYHKAFLLLSWLCLGFYVLSIFVINPQGHVETGFVGFNELKGGYIFRFSMVFIIYGAIHYAIKYGTTSRFLSVLYHGLFLLYLILIRQDRTIVITTLFAVFVFGLFQRKVGSFLKNSAILALGGIGIIVAVSVFQADFFTRSKVLYGSAIEVFTGGESPDGSANVRISEAQKAMPYIERNWLFGSGELSKRWKGGFERVMGKFYPADIGLLGLLFVYGIGGLLLLYSQVWFAWRYAKVKVLDKELNIIHNTFAYALLAFYLNSLSDGAIVFKSAIPLLYLVGLYFGGKEDALLSIEATKVAEKEPQTEK